MGKNKKEFDEKLQEVREHHYDKRRYRLRKQEDDDAKKRMAEFLKWFHKQEDDEDR